MKGLLYIVIALIVIVLVLGMAKDLIIKSAVENGVRMVTGLDLKMASFHAGIFRQVVDIKGLELLSPKGFEDRMMLNMPEIYVTYDLPAILAGRLHIPKMRIYMKELVVVKNARGELNLDSLKPVQAKKAPGMAEERAAGKMPPVLIDKLSLKIGRAIYKDYSRGRQAPSIIEADINIDETYTNIDDPASIVSIIVVRALTNTAIARLVDFDVNGLAGSVSGVLSTATEAAAMATGTTSTATKAVGDVSETVNKAVSGILGAFGGDKK